MSSYLSLLFFTLAIIWFSTHAAKEDEEIKVLKNFGENLFQELDQFSSFPDKDSEAINVQHKLFSRRRRSFPDNSAEQQAGEYSDKTNLDGIQNNPNDAFPDVSSDREEPSPPESNALISEQLINKSDPDKIAVHQSETVQKPDSRNSVAVQQPRMNLPVETLGQQQKQPVVKAESNVAVQQPVQAQNNAVQHVAPVQDNVLQQAAPVQNNVQQAAPVQNNVLQQVAPVQNNVQQAAPVQNNAVQQAAPVQNNALQQPSQSENHVNGLQQQAWAQNSLAEQQMPVKSNQWQQQQPLVQAQSNNGLAHVSEQNTLNKPALIPNGQFQIDQNSLPSHQQNNYPVAQPNHGRQMIDNGGLYAETQNRHMIDNGGLSADQQKPGLINGNDQYVDHSRADNLHMAANKTNSTSEFINKLHPVQITGNKLNVKPPGDQPSVYITPQAVHPGQMSVTSSKVNSSSRAPFFITSTLRNIPKESEHGQEVGKPVSDDGWYYNQEIDDSLHQGVTESEKHAGKQMLMSAHHFDIPLGAFAGAKMFNNDLWQKSHKQYLMNKKSETFEPMSMALFYSWIALATLAVLVILTIFRHRHKVTGYVYDLRHWHNGGYVEEGRRLLHNAYA